MSTGGEPPSTTESRSAPVERTPRSRRHKRIVVGAVVAALVVAGVAGAVVLSGGDGAPTVAKAPTSSSTTTTTVPANPDAGPFTVATTKVPELSVFTAPDAAAETVTILPATSPYGLASTLLVDSATAAPAPKWVPVVVPLHKPNGTAGWVRASDVEIAQTSYSIKVSISQHSLTLLDAGTPVLTTKVIIGTPETPTPIGRFFVTDPVNCNKEEVPGYPVVSCSGAYGVFAMGISALSEKLETFAGAPIAQIALHGTFLPDTELGKDLSNGCVRMPNAVILQIAKTVPLLGVPVTIEA
jgi:lipoprotein-anchoring transpeptidase ErfK/SrfK